ncbi:Anti-sigma regulatory factor (Ser/Thr protein kinase) [Amycolatopsis marina]|uniref:Anti-sigma regulatory factor (Ser/Thr protein kinase) n=1 Tax=Amycolatopsis marina TaxID=490629 RepID=A0A1I1CP63_9PSEU|nr:ATP-binding protein [Amycolatopsis marina]SFB64441.1 Anti-sigma regulatory factor (Ser/Thr protein kinase) [Amycolatopsis marina]
MHRDGHNPPAVGKTACLEYSGVPAEAERLPAIRHALAGWADSVGLSADQVEALTLAAYEALANTVTHAYPDQDGTLDLRAEYQARRALVEVEVTDRGRWQPPPAEPGPLGGRGLPLIHQLSESTRVEPTAHGTVVHMCWSLVSTPQQMSTWDGR